MVAHLRTPIDLTTFFYFPPLILSASMTASAPAVSMRDICRNFMVGEQSVAAVQSLSLEVEQGEFCAIVGPSGSGKSTLLNLLGLLDRPSSGHYRLSGIDTQTLQDSERAVLRNQMLGFVFQQFRLLPQLNVIDNVCLPFVFGGGLQAQGLERAHELLRRVGLSQRERHRPEQLSGGERQRVAFARALVNQPKVLLADEPTGALDRNTGLRMMELMHELHRSSGVTIVMITHDQALAQHCGMRVHMLDGRISQVQRQGAPAAGCAT